MGREIGVKLLIQFPKRIESNLSSSDTIYKIGGDEFVIMLPELHSKKEAKIIAERICAPLKQPWKLKKNTCQRSTSIGVAMYPRDGTSVTTLLINADQALYNANNQGRRQVQFFDFQDC
jgi:diguanylate cyclase (GGDEF)-like protein